MNFENKNKKSVEKLSQISDHVNRKIIEAKRKLGKHTKDFFDIQNSEVLGLLGFTKDKSGNDEIGLCEPLYPPNGGWKKDEPISYGAQHMDSPPIIYEKKPNNAIDFLAVLPQTEYLEKKLKLTPGKRIIIVGIPYYDLEGNGEVIVDRNIQIYRNEEGFLVANKIMEDGGIVKPGVLNLDDMQVYSDPKSLFYGTTKRKLGNGEIQLLTTTYKFPTFSADGEYKHHRSQIEICVTTPDDTGDEIIIEFYGTQSKFPNNIYIREI
jgi:hypothetical protein